MSRVEPVLRELPREKKSRYLHYQGREVMFHARKINPTTDEIEVWECKWTNPSSGSPQKKFIKKVGVESPDHAPIGDYSTAEAVCWAPGRTIGNIAVSSKELLGKFEGKAGSNAVLPCQIIPCGKFRHGKKRWYCKTHQVHWGTKADFEASKNSKTNELECSSKDLLMNYVVEPFEIGFHDFEEIGVWCSMPQALSSSPVTKRSPRIHVHQRKKGRDEKDIDRDFEAIILSYDENLDLFGNKDINKIQVTPPAALEFVLALEKNRDVSCVSCKKCGYPHLDLGDFARKPHRKHYCGNCGNDSVFSSEEIVSTPLKPLHDRFHHANNYIDPKRELNLDDHAGRDFDIWPSTPAIVWTADRPQERGIHVHVYEDGKTVVDDTFSKVILNGKQLDRDDLWKKMIKNTEGV